MAWLSFEVKEQVKIEKIHSFFKLHFEKGHNFAGEMHDFWEVVYVVDGEVVISADENVHKFKSGDIIFHKPLELHKFNVVGDDGVTLFVFSFSMSGEICKKLERKACHLDKYGRGLMKSFIEFYEYEREKIFNNESLQVVHLLSYLSDDNVFLHTLSTYISRIVLSLSDGAVTLSKTKTHETELFKRALEIMNERVAEQLSVSELAASLNMSVSSLKRLFDKYAGMSVHKYFLNLKIKTATLMLKGGMSVSETADTLGFSSAGYFSTTYKRETGNNPSQI
ncbi:MAG: helix-turn-helix transcriptional regulator [Ruminococcaceae bacterium]|nr:helix-turn-helix transcriptional regulator [Oscillospiraceae bacterium]